MDSSSFIFDMDQSSRRDAKQKSFLKNSQDICLVFCDPDSELKFNHGTILGGYKFLGVVCQRVKKFTNYNEQALRK